jgi:hypothetical protein
MVGALLTLTLAAACSIPHPPCDLPRVVYPDGMELHGGPLRLGVSDASRNFPFDLPTALRRTQAELAVIDDVRWGHIEPEPPQAGQHAYQWDDERAALDTRVRTYQQAGFELIMVLRAWNTWARVAAPAGGMAGATASTPPRPETLADYAAWVQAVVERFDADGQDDSPGLVDVDGDGHPDPVRLYQIEAESAAGAWWQGQEATTTAADYIALLRTAAAAARAADANARILAAGAPAIDLLDDFPAAAELEDIVSNINPAVCGGLVALAQVLAADDAYDLVAMHSLADYTGLATLAAWTATLAGKPVEVWITGATSAPALTGDPQELRVHPLFPTSGEGLWSSLANDADPQHQTVESWYRAEQARLGFKKWVFAAANGFDALALGLEQDRPTLEPANLGQRDLAFQGLLDDAGNGSPASRPVVMALALAQAQLGGYSGVQALAGLGDGVNAFAFTVERQTVYALWYDDGIAQEPGAPEPSAVVHLPVRAPQLTQLTIPTRRDQSGPQIDILSPVGGVVTLTLTETPVVIRGEWQAVFLPRVGGSQ